MTEIIDIEDLDTMQQQQHQRHQQHQDVGDEDGDQSTRGGYHHLGRADREGIRKGLLDWFRANRRHLPWRGDPPPYGHRTVTRQKSDKSQPTIQQFFKQRQAPPAPDPAPPPNSSPSPSAPTNVSASVSAYGVWVSEVMLQQTQVATVIEYWLKWMGRWPTAEALSGATLEEVNEVWAGLGYYSRAKNLLEGAKKVMRDYGGVIPSDEKSLRSIPGIGPYTAGAILSIAYSVPTPAVDGNVVRVASRLAAYAAPASARNLLAASTNVARELVKSQEGDEVQSPGDLNQALMELGATVCTPKNPACSVCPISAHCRVQREVRDRTVRRKGHNPSECDVCDPARVDGPVSAGEYPLPKSTAPRKEETYAVAIVERPSDGHILVRQRASKGLLANQWEPPSVLIENSSSGKGKKGDKKRKKGSGDAAVSDQECVQKLRAALEEMGVACDDSSAAPKVGEVTHVFSHVTHHLHVYRIDTMATGHSGGGTSSTDATISLLADASPVPSKWTDPTDLQGKCATYVKKIVACYLEGKSGNRGTTRGKAAAAKKQKKQEKQEMAAAGAGAAVG
ncbi:unnamed protein product [Vitrella brassicaformis CCMP3155]|uniref:Adenine DNA glycosylase n=1 Tax=Vitrella brassicaformis (strain CCMP3155) TaxID=1169540 RepID=A0A0G4G4W4_VITBC|nr:unnamed protein product [Vitrella brassicaformis CCMP3155]|eukprot:CEM23443.1 unnamed protein product [Vitrella brassicaformis CCMP3155]